MNDLLFSIIIMDNTITVLSYEHPYMSFLYVNSIYMYIYVFSSNAFFLRDMNPLI